MPLAPILLFLATLSFGLGLVLPLLEVSRLYVLTDEPSLVDVVAGLWRSGETALAMVIGLFSIVFPALKLVLVHLAAYGAAGRVPKWFGTLANWSMLDVLVVALVIFAAKTSGLASALTRPGLWFFAASVALTAVASAMVRRARG
jgi:paraquat-inducible protein A